MKTAMQKTGLLIPHRQLRGVAEVDITVTGANIASSPVACKSFRELLAQQRNLDLLRDEAWIDSAPVGRETL